MGLRTRVAASLADFRAGGERLVRLNLDLLAAELKQKGAQYAAGLALLVVAAAVAFFALGFALATITAALALVMPLWLALLIVTAVLALLVVLLAVLGRGRLVRAGSPVPERAVAEARATVLAVRAQLGEAVTAATRMDEPSVVASRPAGQAAPFMPAWRARPARPPHAFGEMPAAPPVAQRAAGAGDLTGEP